MKFTIFGGNGFIGKALATHLRMQGHKVFVPARDHGDLSRGNLGHVVYAIGLTADFRTRPIETVDAHVCVLCEVLRTCSFESWLYLSSTRVYGGLDGELATEDAALTVFPSGDGLYNLSKLTGEAVCMSQLSPQVRVVRLSNVYGPGQDSETFLGSLLADIASGRDSLVRETPMSSKDYISIEDACWLLERISLHGAHRLYNVASGESVYHADLVAALSKASSGSFSFSADPVHRSFPQIDISRVADEFKFRPRRLLDELARLVAHSRTPS